MWSFQGIDEPTIVKTEHLPVARALGILSLLPLATPEDPRKLLQRLMLENWTAGLLIAANSGRELPIPQFYWQSEPVEAVFRQLQVTIRFDATAASLWKPFEVAGHVVIQAAQLRHAVLSLSLIERPDLPETWSAVKSDNPLYRSWIAPAIGKAVESTFDEAARRWTEKGEAAQHLQKPTISVPTIQKADAALAFAKIVGAPTPVPVPKVKRGRTWTLAQLLEAELDTTTEKQAAGPINKPSSATRKPRKKSVEDEARRRINIEEVLAQAKTSGIPPTAANKIGPLAEKIANEGRRKHGYSAETCRQILRGTLPSQRRLKIKGYFAS
jgi:hypothetical protein